MTKTQIDEFEIARSDIFINNSSSKIDKKSVGLKRKKTLFMVSKLSLKGEKASNFEASPPSH